MRSTDDNGEEPPFPPDPREKWEIVGAYARLGFWLLVWPMGVGGLALILGQESFTQHGWGRLAFKIVLLIGLILALIYGGGALSLAASLLSRPSRRKRAAPEQKRRMGRFSPAQIDEEIAHAREVLSYLRDVRKRRGWERWLAWLERQSNVPPAKRSTLAPGTYRALKPAWIKAVLGSALMAALVVWLTWDRDPWTRWGLAGFVGLIFMADPVIHIGERLELTDDTLSYYAFGRHQWTAPREHIATKLVDVDTSNYELYDPRTGKLLGSVGGSTFGIETVEALIDLFPPFIKREEA